MRTRLSICRRKRRFADTREAIDFAQAHDLALWPYRCDRCGMIHLTSRRKGKWRPLS